MKTFLRIFEFIKPYCGYIILSILFVLLFALMNSALLYMVAPVTKFLFGPGGLPEISPPVSSGPHSLFDMLKELLQLSYQKYMLKGTKGEILKRFCIMIFLLMLFKNISFWLQAYFSSRALESIIRDIRFAIYKHLQTLSMGFFTKKRTGELVSRTINDTGLLNEMISLSISNLIKDPFLVVIYFVFLLVLNWRLTLLILVALPPVLFGMNKLGKHLKRYSLKGQERMAELYSHLQETLESMKIVKAFGTKEYEIQRFWRRLNEFFKVNLKRIWVQKLSTPFNEVIGTGVAIFIFWYGGKQVLELGTFRPEEFVQYIFALLMIMQPIKALANDYANIMQGLAAAERIFALIDTPPEIKSVPNAPRVKGFKECISFNNVSFWYSPDKEPALKNVTFTLHKGEILAIVGPSGSGKTTITELMLRFYDPQQGKICLDNTDIRELELWSYRSLFGLVTQDVILFYETIKGNIAYGLNDVPLEDIIEVAKIANAHDFIMRLPQGYDTIIGERGVTLSGGERQRIAIARAIIRSPEILILDEATSSLDTESEMLVQEAIERIIKGRTVLVIAHRLSTVRNAHRIIVLDKGEIVEEGNHETLIEANGLYKTLYSLQFNI